jgi:hypothetical protein
MGEERKNQDPTLGTATVGGSVHRSGDIQREIAAGIEQLDRGEEDVLDIAAIKAQARRDSAL